MEVALDAVVGALITDVDWILVVRPVGDLVGQPGFVAELDHLGHELEVRGDGGPFAVERNERLAAVDDGDPVQLDPVVADLQLVGQERQAVVVSGKHRVLLGLLHRAAQLLVDAGPTEP